MDFSFLFFFSLSLSRSLSTTLPPSLPLSSSPNITFYLWLCLKLTFFVPLYLSFFLNSRPLSPSVRYSLCLLSFNLIFLCFALSLFLPSSSYFTHSLSINIFLYLNQRVRSLPSRAPELILLQNFAGSWGQSEEVKTFLPNNFETCFSIAGCHSHVLSFRFFKNIKWQLLLDSTLWDLSKS